MDLFQIHYRHNSTYRQYCDYRKIEGDKVQSIKDIPFLPIDTFKSHTVQLNRFEAEITFESSGTTANTSSKHFVKKSSIYEKSFTTAFENFYGKAEDYCILALLPSYLERGGSSLVYMAEKLIQQSKHKESGFYLTNHQTLYETLNKLAKNGQKTLLIGVSFALLDFAEKYKVNHTNLIVMETGGMKGRRKEIIREELHEILCNSFQLNSIHSEYGMTELLSQAYSKGNGKFYTPQWMKVLARKQDDPFSYANFGETAALNIVDLANIYSCPFIQTDDLGKVYADGSFEVLGRFDRATVRGCNLMVR